MYEVEVKVEAAHGPVRERLAALDAEPRGAVHQRDTYYDHPVRSFAETDEALRLRRESGSAVEPGPEDESGRGGGPGLDQAPGSRSKAHSDASATATLTYKGPRVDDTSKTRREVETRVEAPEALDDLLRSVGFEPAAEVEKERERFDCAGYAVALDRVDGLGEFVEVETRGGEAEVSDLRDGAFELCERLGLDPDDAVRSSYLALLLADD